VKGGYGLFQPLPHLDSLPTEEVPVMTFAMMDIVADEGLPGDFMIELQPIFQGAHPIFRRIGDGGLYHQGEALHFPLFPLGDGLFLTSLPLTHFV
jgi:hypothetical protein